MTFRRSLSWCLAVAGVLGGCSTQAEGTDSDIVVDADPDSAPSVESVTACGTTQQVSSASASVAQDGNPASQAVDGNLATRWSGLGIGAYLTLDLGQSRSLCSASVAWYAGNTRTSRFALAVSTDGTNFTQVYAGTSSGTTAGLESYAFTARTARYVRLTVNGNSLNDWASVSEMTVAGSPVGFRHPGVLVSREQLDFVKARIAAGAQPWKSAFDRARGSRFGSTSVTPHATTTIEAGPSNNPCTGCNESTDDAVAAYTQALLWYHTGDASYARRAIAIMNAWATTLSSSPGYNTPLWLAWGAEVWPRAAEIIRYTYTGWSAAEIQRFSAMLTNVYLPRIQNGWYGGNNWETSMIEATMNIAVFTDNRALFDHAVSMWRGAVPAYVYLSTDGAVPVRPRVGTFTDAQLLANWKNPPRLVDGMSMETCRDLGHTGMGMAGIFNAAETARLQGINLYAEQSRRLTLATEFHATYMNGAPVPSWLCTGTLNQGGSAGSLTYEIGYNHYANRAGASLPQTAALLARTRPSSAGLHMDWETLTHAGTGTVGIR